MFKLLWHFLALISQCFVAVTPMPDVATICGPGTNQSLAQEVQASQWQASKWLLENKNEEWGWDMKSTGRAILSLQLANETWTSDLDSLESRLTIKQLQIELLHKLSHKQTFRDMSIGDLAYFSMALHATCHDVSDFRGHNILRQLHLRVENFPGNETTNFFPYSLALLAICNSGNDVPRNSIGVLEEAQGADGCFPFPVDGTSMALMAMSCIKPSFNNPTRLESLKSMIRKGIKCLLKNQHDDGGFGRHSTNTISTALAAQALIAAETAPSRWDCERALGVILGAQDQEGHFGSQGGTIQILPVLSNRHHGSLADMEQDCPVDEELLTAPPMMTKFDDTITINLEISQQVGPIGIFAPIAVDALSGENLYQAMDRARQIGYLQFESRMTMFGSFVTSINNITNNDADGHYWFIYEVDENGNQVSAQTGPEGIYPEDGSTFAWIYKEYIAH